MHRYTMPVASTCTRDAFKDITDKEEYINCSCIFLICGGEYFGFGNFPPKLDIYFEKIRGKVALARTQIFHFHLKSTSSWPYTLDAPLPCKRVNEN